MFDEIKSEEIVENSNNNFPKMFQYDIKEGDDIINKWYEKAKQVTNPEQLKEFCEYVYSSGRPDYGPVVHAVTAIAIAASWCANENYGITGFQASFVGLEYLLHWTYDYKDTTGIRVINYSDMLYPQFDYRFEKTISTDIFKGLQEIAKKNLDEGGGIEKVREHWQSIVDGNVPFGYKIADNVL